MESILGFLRTWTFPSWYGIVTNSSGEEVACGGGGFDVVGSIDFDVDHVVPDVCAEKLLSFVVVVDDDKGR